MGSLRRRLAQLPWRMAASETWNPTVALLVGLNLGAMDIGPQLLPFVSYLCAGKLIRTFLGVFTVVKGPSMLPTLNQAGDMVAVDMIPKWWGQFNTGDVVLMRSPNHPPRYLVKRILGVEGEMVTYLVDPAKSKTTRLVLVPEGHVWVQGDNIYNSYDSRYFGPVPLGLVQGRIFYRVWPPEKVGPIDSKVWPPEKVSPIDSKANPNEPPTK